VVDLVGRRSTPSGPGHSWREASEP